MDQPNNQLGTLIAAGVLLGMSGAAFFDGIVLHQLLQWHHMLSSVRPITSLSNLKANTLWDGYFLAGASVITIAGFVLLWRALSNSNLSWSFKPFSGSLLIGAGAFNLIEGIIDHHILRIHHVKSGPNELAWDIGFLTISAVLVAMGWILLRTQRQDVQPKLQKLP